MMLDPVCEPVEMDVRHEESIILRNGLDGDRPGGEPTVNCGDADDPDVRSNIDEGLEMEGLAKELERPGDPLVGSVPVDKHIAGDDLVRREDHVGFVSILNQAQPGLRAERVESGLVVGRVGGAGR